MAQTIKTNYIFNLINTISVFLFPVITFPYASRIMLAEGIGLVNFYQSIIQYIILLTCLGIPMYAIREIAKVRDNVEECNRVTQEILLLHLILTALGYIIVVGLCIFIQDIQTNIPLFLILSTSILFTTIGCDWFYQGIEDFKYITIRGLIVRTLAIIFLFVFVKTKEDILWYGCYAVIGSLGGNLFNFIRLRKYIHISSYKLLKPFRHLKPALHIFLLNIIVSFYIHINSVMLGFLKSPKDVGFFIAASKLSQMILGIATALGTVMLPRLSNLIANNQKENFNILAQKAMRFMIGITLPLSVGAILIASDIIPLFCGEKYQPAILTFRIISPIIFFVGVSNILGIQILYPQGQENKVILCTAIGAILNLTFNSILIPAYSHVGTAISALIAEFGVTTSMIFIGKKYIPIHWKDKSFNNYIIGTILMATIIIFINYFNTSHWTKLILSFSLGCTIYCIYLKITHDDLYNQAISYITFKRFIRRKKI